MTEARVVMSDHLLWFEDHRYRPQQQAQYLGKLSRLRSDLLREEQAGVSTVLSRFQGPGTPGSQQRAITGSLASGRGESTPERHRRLQREKAFMVQSHRQGNPSPQLGSLSGKKLIDDIHDQAKVRKQSPTTRTEVSDVIAEQRSRLESFGSPGMSTPSTSSSRQGGSVNSRCLPEEPLDEPLVIRRKALRQPGRLLPLQTRSQSDDALVSSGTGRQRRALIRADSDTLDLCPDSYRLDRADDDDDDDGEDHAEECEETSNGYSEPNTTPSHSATQRTNDYFFPGNRARVPLPNIPYSQSYRVRHLRKTGHIHRHPNLPRQRAIVGGRQNSMAATGRPVVHDLPRIPVSIPERIRTTELEPETHDHSNQKKCILCEHPELMSQLVPVCAQQKNFKEEEREAEDEEQQQQQQQLHPSPEPTQLDDDSGDDPTQEGSSVQLNIRRANIHIPQAGPSSPSPDPTKQELTVHMPDIVFKPPSPMPDDQESQKTATNLRKVTRQNELREREVRNLLEDVEELNGLTQVLETQMTME